MSRFRTLTPSTLTREAFIEAFCGIYEHSPWVAERTYDQGQPASFDTIDGLHSQMAAVLRAAGHDKQLALINAHPDLAGKEAVCGELTAASTSEQAGAGIQQSSAEELARFNELNDIYKTRFGFPFIKAVKGSNRQEILAAFELRIHHTLEQEFATALTEINKIALLRLQAL